MEKKKITKKTNEEKVSLKDKILNSIKNFFNKPAPLFITLIIIIFVLLMYISSILSSRDIFVGEVEKADLRINNIHYYTDGNNRYFYADPAEYTAEDKLIYEYQIGYFVKNNKGELIELASRSGSLKDNISLSQMIKDMSKWNFLEKKDKAYFFSKDVMPFIHNLHFIVKASTVKGNTNPDIDLDYEVYITSFK